MTLPENRRLIIPDFEIDNTNYIDAEPDVCIDTTEESYGRLKIMRNAGSAKLGFAYDALGVTNCNFTLEGDDVTLLPFKAGVLSRQGSASLDIANSNVIILPRGASTVTRVTLFSLIDSPERLYSAAGDALTQLMQTVHERPIEGVVYDACVEYGYDQVHDMDIVRVAMGGLQHPLNFRNIRLPAQAPVVAALQGVPEFA